MKEKMLTNEETASFNLSKDWPFINYLAPFYDENGGNSTIICLENKGIVVDKRKMKTLMKKLAGEFAVDLGMAKKKYGDLVGRKDSAPIPLHVRLILLPLKLRKPLTKDDGAWGYVVLDKLNQCHPLNEGEYRSILTFNDGSQLKTMVTPEAIIKQKNDAWYVQDRYAQLQQMAEASPGLQPVTSFNNRSSCSDFLDFMVFLRDCIEKNRARV